MSSYIRVKDEQKLIQFVIVINFPFRYFLSKNNTNDLRISLSEDYINHDININATLSQENNQNTLTQGSDFNVEKQGRKMVLAINNMEAQGVQKLVVILTSQQGKITTLYVEG